MQTYKTYYLGKNLKEAKKFAEADKNIINDDQMRVKSIKLRKNSRRVRVQWEGREGELVKRYDVTYIVI